MIDRNHNLSIFQTVMMIAQVPPQDVRGLLRRGGAGVRRALRRVRRRALRAARAGPAPAPRHERHAGPRRVRHARGLRRPLRRGPLRAEEVTHHFYSRIISLSTPRFTSTLEGEKN